MGGEDAAALSPSRGGSRGGPRAEYYWHVRTTDEAFADAGSGKNGLDMHEAHARLKRSGPNTLAQEDRFRTFKLLLRQCNNVIVALLSATALISLYSDHHVEFFVILVIILLTVLLGFLQEHHAERSIAALSKLTQRTVTVLRGGKRHVIAAEHLVPGDVVVIRRGMIVPADLRLVESRSLAIDESILTGESATKRKMTAPLATDTPLSDRNNMAFSGTSVVGGEGLGLVVATGLSSEIGKVSELLKKIGDQSSPLRGQIDRMSRRLSLAVVIICALLFLVFMLRQETLYAALILCAAVAVSGIPESFPLAVTLALSSGLRRMAKANAIVRDLSSVETLGTCTVICTDKTGTLTENRMRVALLHLPDGRDITIEGVGYEPKGSFLLQRKAVTPDIIPRQVLLACALCNDANLSLSEGAWTVDGEATEGALVALVRRAGVDEITLREAHPRLREIPFDPARKYMVTVNKDGGGSVAYLKGAAERVLEKCTHVRHGSNVKVLAAAERVEILKRLRSSLELSYRVLGIASKQLHGPDAHGPDADLEKGYTLEGFVCLEDPIRKDAVQAIAECHSAGIRVIMVTGDHRGTAEAIAAKLGLLRPGLSRVLEGADIDVLSDEELDAAVADVAVFARTTPDHKYRIVTALQRRGEIVAMTGDGVNDAPALKKADIGVAMGKNGTDVARESANMILTDDNFATIVHAVREGRTIYSNIRRFVYYLLTGNFTEVSLIVVTVLLSLPLPLTAIMILFINLVTSTIPALALSIEPTHDKVMRQRPRPPRERLLSGYILTKILVLVPLLLFGTLSLFFWELNIQGGALEKARTVAFAALIMFELFHVFNARSLHTTIFQKGFFRNPAVFVAIGISLLLTVIVISTPVGNVFFGTVLLSSSEWLVVAVVGSLVVGVSETIKALIKGEFEEQRTLRGIDVSLE